MGHKYFIGIFNIIRPYLQQLLQTLFDRVWECVKYVLFHDVQEINYASHFLCDDAAKAYRIAYKFFFAYVIELDCKTMMMKYLCGYFFVKDAARNVTYAQLKAFCALEIEYDWIIIILTDRACVYVTMTIQIKFKQHTLKNNNNNKTITIQTSNSIKNQL